MDEIVRVVDALQLSARASVATPANWPNNHENIGAKGWAFLLPTVTPEVWPTPCWHAQTRQPR